MKYILVLLSFAWIFPIQAEGVFDGSCFREKAEVVVLSGITSVGVRDVFDDVFVVSSDGKLLPSRQISTEKNPPIQYSSNDTLDTELLDDSDPYTGIEIDPVLFTKGDVVYTFDLGKVYIKGQIVPILGYVTDRKVSVSISVDGKSFVPVSQAHLGDFDMRYLKVVFSGSGTQNGITRFHTLNFFQRVQSRYLLSSSGGTIHIYRSYACQQGKYQSFLSQRPSLPYLAELPEDTISLQFEANPLYKDDSDGDGIENLRDNCPLISNPDQSDRDHDGIGDLCSDDDGDNRFGESDNCPTVPNSDQKDLNANGVGDACEFDTDGDGIPDSIDNAIHIKNPDQKDLDNDRIGDVMDNCPLYNPDQLDLDKNGKGDICDKDEAFKKTHDADNDGILDYSDNCSKIANPDQADTDGDGIGNVCDNCRDLKNPDQSDSNKNAIGDVCEDVDMDSIIGWRDNCPFAANEDQKDSDNNGIGDACSDIDGDSIFDSLDNCATFYNPQQNDIDHDGKGDACDTKDDRFLESNKYIFMGLIAIFGLIFISSIIILIRKLQ